MKTLKIDEQTHIRLTLFKNIIGEKNFSKALETIMDQAAIHMDEYSMITGTEYNLIKETIHYDK